MQQINKVFFRSLTRAVGQRRARSVEARSPPQTGQVFRVGGRHCGGAGLVWWSEAFGWALGSWRADGTGRTESGLIRERVWFGGDQCAAVQM